MKYKILVLDIDGTLNNSQKEITQKTKKSIIEAQESGVIIAIASGRPTCGITHIVHELELEKFGGYVLSYNGGRITNCKTGEIVFEKLISSEHIAEIYDLSEELGVNIMTYSGDNVFTEFCDEYVMIEHQITNVKIQIVEDFKAEIDFSVPKFIMTGDGETLAKIEPFVRDKLSDRFTVFRSEPFFLEIMPNNIDKAYSLGKLLEHLNISKAELIACGDGFNDVSMVDFAGLGVAMANAQPQVKEVAQFITLSNDDDGISYVIDKFIFTN